MSFLQRARIEALNVMATRVEGAGSVYPLPRKNVGIYNFQRAGFGAFSHVSVTAVTAI